MSPVKLSLYWPKIDAVIERAETDPAFQDVLHYGTPSQKLEALKQYGLFFEDLVIIHRQLEKVVFQGSLKFWWW